MQSRMHACNDFKYTGGKAHRPVHVLMWCPFPIRVAVEVPMRITAQAPNLFLCNTTDKNAATHAGGCMHQHGGGSVDESESPAAYTPVATCHLERGHPHIPSTTHLPARSPMPTTSTIPMCKVCAIAHACCGLHFQISKYDSVSEWLRRWTRNPLGSARRGLNPLAADSMYWAYMRVCKGG